MGYPTVRFQSNTVTRAPSAELWRNLLDRYSSDDENVGSLYYEDFVDKLYSNTTDASAQNGWFIQDAAAGGTSESLLTSASPDGVVVLSAATGTAHFGIEMHRGASATSAATVNLPTHASDARGAVCYETRVDLDDADACFIGLTEAIVGFLSATSTLPTNSDYIGFYRTAGGDLQFVCDEADSGSASAVTVVAAASIPAGYNKLGFRVNADKSVEIFVNEEKITVDTSGATITIPEANLPNESLTQKYAIGRGGGSSTTVDLPIDWVRCYVAQ